MPIVRPPIGFHFLGHGIGHGIGHVAASHGRFKPLAGDIPTRDMDVDGVGSGFDGNHDREAIVTAGLWPICEFVIKTGVQKI